MRTSSGVMVIKMKNKHHTTYRKVTISLDSYLIDDALYLDEQSYFTARTSDGNQD
jgi:hypothetical protein